MTSGRDDAVPAGSPRPHGRLRGRLWRLPLHTKLLAVLLGLAALALLASGAAGTAALRS
ncbi:MAG: hypothetical protein M3Q27_08485 [Actinomycetota bacterium]|nr:hypothetical protein [Actinomycetota bacterium]